MLRKYSPLMFVGCLALGACDVDQTKEGELPEVEVNASGGQLPEFDVDAPTVNVCTEGWIRRRPHRETDASTGKDRLLR